MKDDYKDNLDMNQFKRINEISSYNNNYYIGFNNDLLFGKSDDDNITEWFIIDGNDYPIPIGYSLTSNNDKLIRMDSRCT